MSNKFKKLIISPHIDDDILGCGGILDKNTLVLYCGVDEFHIIPKSSGLEEAKEASKILGHKFELMSGNKVNNYKVQDLIDKFSYWINTVKPEEVYIPFPSYNQDHKTVFEASLIALRPHDVNFFVKKVLIYEQPHVYLWNHSYDLGNSSFDPNFYVPIDIEKKLEAYRAMPSQVRDFRSEEHVRALSVLRGGQSNCKNAEAFQIIRYIKD